MTRMWMLPPPILCRNHLLGEHKEIHQLVGAIRKGRWKVIKGHARLGQIETRSIAARHEELVQELLRRGYNHHSPLPAYPPTDIGRVDPTANLDDLTTRCGECLRRYVLYRRTQ